MTSILGRVLVILTTISLTSCGEKSNDLAGNWRPIRLDYEESMHWGLGSMDFSKMDSIRFVAFETELEGHDPATPFDSIAVRKKIDSMINYCLGARLSLEPNSNFAMIGHDMFISKRTREQPHDDTVKGKWLTRNDSLILDISNASKDSSISYRILKVTRDSLVVRDSIYPEDFRPTRIITFIRG